MLFIKVAISTCVAISCGLTTLIVSYSVVLAFTAYIASGLVTAFCLQILFFRTRQHLDSLGETNVACVKL